MAEEKQTQALKDKKKEKPEKKVSEKKEHKKEEEQYESLIRIFGYDIPGSRNLYTGLTKIKGVSWPISNAVCLKLNMPHSKRCSELTKEDVKKIEGFLANMNIPDYMKNRRKDEETGKTSHLFASDLDISRDFDIKRLKKIKSYKGVRHAYKLPVRGQRTRSHFRSKVGSAKVRRKAKTEQ